MNDNTYNVRFLLIYNFVLHVEYILKLSRDWKSTKYLFIKEKENSFKLFLYRIIDLNKFIQFWQNHFKFYFFFFKNC